MNFKLKCRYVKSFNGYKHGQNLVIISTETVIPGRSETASSVSSSSTESPIHHTAWTSFNVVSWETRSNLRDANFCLTTVTEVSFELIFYKNHDNVSLKQNTCFREQFYFAELQYENRGIWRQYTQLHDTTSMLKVVLCHVNKATVPDSQIIGNSSLYKSGSF